MILRGTNFVGQGSKEFYREPNLVCKLLYKKTWFRSNLSGTNLGNLKSVPCSFSGTNSCCKQIYKKSWFPSNL